MTARDHLTRVHSVACVVCTHMGMTQISATVAHHVESVRDDNSHFATAALCNDCHNELHRVSRRAFTMRYGLSDIDLIALTLAEMDAQNLFITLKESA